MALLDINSDIKARRLISPLTGTDNTAFVSQIIDLANIAGILFVVQTGTLADADATFTALLEEGNASDMSDASAVASADRLGSLPSFTFANDDAVYTVGYRGAKRYLRLTITPASNSGSAPISAVAITMYNRKQP